MFSSIRRGLAIALTKINDPTESDRQVTKEYQRSRQGLPLPHQ
ncbi:MAG: hypothetical protein AAGA60_00790 [Cyanobacteria bacterium P01_E01_bin.42]